MKTIIFHTTILSDFSSSLHLIFFQQFGISISISISKSKPFLQTQKSHSTIEVCLPRWIPISILSSIDSLSKTHNITNSIFTGWHSKLIINPNWSPSHTPDTAEQFIFQNSTINDFIILIRICDRHLFSFHKKSFIDHSPSQNLFDFERITQIDGKFLWISPEIFKSFSRIGWKWPEFVCCPPLLDRSVNGLHVQAKSKKFFKDSEDWLSSENLCGNSSDSTLIGVMRNDLVDRFIPYGWINSLQKRSFVNIDTKPSFGPGNGLGVRRGWTTESAVCSTNSMLLSL